MTHKTITLRDELVERLQQLAQKNGQSVDEAMETLLDYAEPRSQAGNWALAVAQDMAMADIEWRDDLDLSSRSGAHYQDYLADKWREQQASTDNDDDASS